MKVLLYSHVFHPSTGGVETVSMELAEGFVRSGIHCKVITRTPQQGGTNLGFEVIECADKRRERALVRWADVVLFNGASLALQPWVTLYRKPFVWVHVGYQARTIDGAGWWDGAPAPMTPWASVRHHAKRNFKGAVREGLKLALRRFVAKRLVTRNVAITKWMAQANPLPRQVQIYNPFPVGRFAEGSSSKIVGPMYDFMYLGRLVSEKGVDVLLKAFAKVVEGSPPSTSRLLIIGDGECRGSLEQLAKKLGIWRRVTFAGSKHGDALVECVWSGRIAVVPSSWNEPMGGVVVELMAAGRCVIVSERGGLAECLGDAGLTFPNGDVDALAEQMTKLVGDKELQITLAARARKRAMAFAPAQFVDQYISLLREVANKGSAPTQTAPEEQDRRGMGAT
jgi:glycosyltransferase involved in cell wall biosynthesis